MTLNPSKWFGFLQGDPKWDAILAGDAAHCGSMRWGCGPITVARWVPGGRPVYLATPYSREVLDANGAWDHRKSYNQKYGAAKAALALMDVGVTALLPIILSAEIIHASMHDEKPVPRIDPLDPVLWERWCRPMLDACCAVVIPDLPGWQRSRGIWFEALRAMDRQCPVFVYAGGL